MRSALCGQPPKDMGDVAECRNYEYLVTLISVSTWMAGGWTEEFWRSRVFVLLTTRLPADSLHTTSPATYTGNHPWLQRVPSSCPGVHNWKCRIQKNKLTKPNLTLMSADLQYFLEFRFCIDLYGINGFFVFDISNYASRVLTDRLVEHHPGHLLRGVLGLSDVGDSAGHCAAHPDSVPHAETVRVCRQDVV